MAYNTCTLPNGLRLIHAPGLTDVTYCGFAVNAGTRDELPGEEGMAHFVEHMLFKGTGKRRAWHILNRMENVGGDLNAYTSMEETVVYCVFLREHFARAAELLADIVFHSTFPQAKIDKEVEVIIDEIQSYEDSPAELIFDHFEEVLFPDHPLGRNILGKPKRLRQYRTEDALRFTARHYRPDNMVFFIQGNVDFRRVVRTIEKLTADLPAATTSLPVRTTPAPYVPRTLTLPRDTHQTHVITGGRSYDAHDERRTALCLLNNLLGGSNMNSRLNVAMRERLGLVYTVEANLTSYTDTGVFSIYFGTDPADTDRCLDIVRHELERLCDKPISATQLAAAKKQIKGQIGVASDNFEENALNMAKAFLHYGRVEGQNELFRRIDALTSRQLWDVANDVFRLNNLSTLIFC